ncbi:MAG: tripartite tricarboxylate transporter substrate binding protein [Hyphomicrobiaceae bacterium]
MAHRPYTIKRRTIVKGLGAALAAPALITGAAAQSAAAYPNKPITLIVPWGAGTGIDLWHRALAEAAGKILGQPVVVDNKAGASGTAGPATMAATAKPDGYTISHIPITVFRFPFMQKTTYDPLKDFSYIIHMSGFLFGTYCRTDSPFKTFKDVIAFARAKPGELTYGSPGAGTSLHIGMEQIALREGIKWTHVPFTQGSDAAVLGGHVMVMASGSQWWPHTDAGNMRVLVLWSEKRNPRIPDTPTLQELGYPFVFDSPFGIAGPKGMDPAVVKKLHDAFKLALDDPKARDIQKKYDYVERYMDSAAYTRFVGEQVAEQKTVLEKLGLAKKE